MKIVFITILIIYFISIYPAFYFAEKVFNGTFYEMIDRDSITERQFEKLKKYGLKRSIKISLTPVVNLFALLIFMLCPISVIYEYIARRLQFEDVDSIVEQVLQTVEDSSDEE